MENKNYFKYICIIIFCLFFLGIIFYFGNNYNTKTQSISDFRVPAGYDAEYDRIQKFLAEEDEKDRRDEEERREWEQKQKEYLTRHLRRTKIDHVKFEELFNYLEKRFDDEKKNYSSGMIINEILLDYDIDNDEVCKCQLAREIEVVSGYFDYFISGKGKPSPKMSVSQSEFDERYHQKYHEWDLSSERMYLRNVEEAKTEEEKEYHKATLERNKQNHLIICLLIYEIIQ